MSAWWDEDLTEPAQCERCAEELRTHFPFRQGPGAFHLHDAKGMTVKTTFEGVPYSLAGRHDEPVILKRSQDNPLKGAIMGFELKKKLVWASVHQAKAEFLLFAPKSKYSYCQVATDFVTGAIAYYFIGDTSGHHISQEESSRGWIPFGCSILLFLDGVPEDFGSDEHRFQEELPNFKHLRFEIPKQSGRLAKISDV